METSPVRLARLLGLVTTVVLMGAGCGSPPSPATLQSADGIRYVRAGTGLYPTAGSPLSPADIRAEVNARVAQRNYAFKVDPSDLEGGRLTVPGLGRGDLLRMDNWLPVTVETLSPNEVLPVQQDAMSAEANRAAQRAYLAAFNQRLYRTLVERSLIRE